VYLQFFGLSEAPFSITPDPAFVYLSAAHRDALAHLLYGVGKDGAGGFVQLTGEVGTGKTTICRCLLEQVPEDTVIALILNPMLSPRELLATICQELGIEVAGLSDSSKALVDTLNAYLLEQHALGRRVVVVIDEAQNLSPDALEQVRLLTNLETAKHKLMQMVLLGQPELRQLLERQNLRQLAQRITARYHLAPLGERDTCEYLRHRMKVAGARQNPFKRSAMRALYQRSAGVPRLINIIADRALAGAYVKESPSVDARLVHAAANEVKPSESRVRAARWPLFAGVACALLLAALSLFSWGVPWLQPRTPAVVSEAVSVGSGQDAASLAGTTEAVHGQSADAAAGELAVDAPPAPTSAVESSAQDGSAAALAGSAGAVAATAQDVLPATRVEMPALDAAWLDRQHGMVWRGLAELWQDSGHANAIQAACDGRTRTGYACLHDRGSWARVQSLGLPVILVLHGQENRHVLLRGMGDRYLLLGAGEESQTFSRSAVESQWLGEYIVAWPQAPDWPVEIKRGESGAAIEIVMRLAAQAHPAWTEGRVFDAGFEQWLIDFQRRNAIPADGIIGPRTLLYLMAPTIAEPRLSTDWEERS
jgi:general secretion pathway protein A